MPLKHKTKEKSLTNMQFRVGLGYDVHQLVEGRKLILGGIEIPHEKGALGHSDADVLLHAICDAILGAAGKKDIGYYFPNTSSEFKDADSKILLEHVIKIVEKDGWTVNNVDATLVLEKPKINPHIDKMKAALLPILKVEDNALAIKATTSEKLGFVGNELGVQAHAVASLVKE